MRPRATVIRVKNNDVDYLLTNLALRITIPFRYAVETPSVLGPFEEDVMLDELLTCGVEECEHGVGWWYGYQLKARPQGGRMNEKLLVLSEDAASSSSEDMSTTAGSWDVMCVRKVCAYSPQRGVASCMHLRSSFYTTWAGGFPIFLFVCVLL